MVVLGRDGTVQDYHVGYDAHVADTLPAKIEKLLAGENLAQQEIDAYQEAQQAFEQRVAEVLVEASGATGTQPEVARKPETAQ
jgi:hypothetical protein